MALMLILHLFCKYITGGIQPPPPNLKSVTGVTLDVNYSYFCSYRILTWDQAAFRACKVVTGVPEALPIIGPPIVCMLRA